MLKKSIAGIAETVIFAALLVPNFAHARGASSRSYSTDGQSSTYDLPHGSRPKALDVPRDSHGRIARSPHAKYEFKKLHPCPATGLSSGACPGYVIDHVIPLKRGGADNPDNMQWQTSEAAKIKDRTE